MTDRVRSSLNKISAVLGIIVVLVAFIASTVRTIDASTQALNGIEKLSVRLDREISDRMAEGRTLADTIVNERDVRKDEYTKIQVKLSEIDTRLLYIQQSIDRIGSR